MRRHLNGGGMIVAAAHATLDLPDARHLQLRQ
jgi:ABC-type transport system involved in cytochrome c biogenesis ATPase subunit